MKANAKKTLPPRRRGARQDGFTLVELAISLLVVGVLLAGTFSIPQYIKAERVRSTQQKIDYVMNVLSAYVQTHYRLPCPADPNALPAAMGHETDNGKCFFNATNSAMYWEAEGIVPWKELGIPQDMVVDSWGHYITYKPAPNLTVDTQSAQMQDTGGQGGVTGPNTPDVNNACRTSMWYDSFGNHLNRAKALFCCNAQPKSAYLTGPGGQTTDTLDPNWRKSGIVDTSTAAGITANANASLPDNTPVQLTAAWADDGSNAAVNGVFSQPQYLQTGGQAPLLRATGPAVELISHGGDGNLAFLPEQPKKNLFGGNTVTPAGGVTGAAIDTEVKNVWPPQMFAAVLGHPKVADGTFDLLNGGNGKASDDIVSYMRNDQLFARVGGGSCEYPPAAAAQLYSCVPQQFTKPGSGVGASNSYGLQLKLTGSQKYQLRTSFTQRSSEAGYDNSIGFYIIGSDGTMQDVTMVAPNVKKVGTNNTTFASADLDSSMTSLGVGIFIVSNGANVNNYSNLNMNGLEFDNASGQPATVNDTAPPRLMSNNADGTKTEIVSTDPTGSAFHLNSNLNPGQAGHQLRPENVCQAQGQKVGVNHDVTCKGPTAIQQVGIDPNNPSTIQIGFEDLPQINCYEMSDGKCSSPAKDPSASKIPDGFGGYIANIGDNDYDDVDFSFAMTACPQGQ